MGFRRLCAISLCAVVWMVVGSPAQPQTARQRVVPIAPEDVFPSYHLERHFSTVDPSGNGWFPAEKEYVAKWKGEPFDEHLLPSFRARLKALLNPRLYEKIAAENIVYVRRDHTAKNGYKWPIVGECFFSACLEEPDFVLCAKGWVEHGTIVVKSSRIVPDAAVQQVFAKYEKKGKELAAARVSDECLSLDAAEVGVVRGYVAALTKTFLDEGILPRTQEKWDEMLRKATVYLGAIEIELPPPAVKEDSFGQPLDSVRVTVNGRTLLVSFTDRCFGYGIGDGYPSLKAKLDPRPGETEADVRPLNPDEVRYLETGIRTSKHGTEVVEEKAVACIIKVLLKDRSELTRPGMGGFEDLERQVVKLPVTEAKWHILEYALLVDKFYRVAPRINEYSLSRCLQSPGECEKVQGEIRQILPGAEKLLAWLSGLRYPRSLADVHQRLVKEYSAYVDGMRFVSGETLTKMWKEIEEEKAKAADPLMFSIEKKREMKRLMEEKLVSWGKVSKIHSEIQETRLIMLTE